MPPRLPAHDGRLSPVQSGIFGGATCRQRSCAFCFHGDPLPIGHDDFWLFRSTYTWQHGFNQKPTHYPELMATALPPGPLKRRARDEARQLARHAAVAREAQEIWQCVRPLGLKSPYLVRKHLEPAPALCLLEAPELHALPGYAARVLALRFRERYSASLYLGPVAIVRSPCAAMSASTVSRVVFSIGSFPFPSNTSQLSLHSRRVPDCKTRARTVRRDKCRSQRARARLATRCSRELAVRISGLMKHRGNY
ncbi:hypothetical protein B0G76_2567 [Paraburkholderia sp. BL23I1N1]|nr:hypothetical protein B0G76_2567 [Paraburkholderia sp. BL23I1N1]